MYECAIRPIHQVITANRVFCNAILGTGQLGTILVQMQFGHLLRLFQLRIVLPDRSVKLRLSDVR